MGFPIISLRFVTTLIAVVSIYGCAITSGSIITFEKTPDILKALLTPSMTLHCSLNDTTSAATSALIGRDVTETSDDVHFVTSMVIMRPNGDHVASITQVTGAKAIDNDTNLKVTGSLTVTGGVESTLTLEWTYPEQSQESIYTCEVNTMNDLGHSVTFTKQLTVEFEEPTIMDLVGHIHQQEITDIDHKNLIANLETEIKSERNKTSGLQTQIGNQHTQITNQLNQITDFQTQIVNLETEIKSERNKTSGLQTRVDNQHTQISDLQKQIVNLKNQDTQTMASLAKMKHIETGELSCGNSDNWQISGAYKHKDVSHTFSSSYDSNPVVYAAVDTFSHDINHNVEFYIGITTISKTGFTIRCTTKGADMVWGLRARWISFFQ